MIIILLKKYTTKYNYILLFIYIYLLKKYIFIYKIIYLMVSCDLIAICHVFCNLIL